MNKRHWINNKSIEIVAAIIVLIRWALFVFGDNQTAPIALLLAMKRQIIFINSDITHVLASGKNIMAFSSSFIDSTTTTVNNTITIVVTIISITFTVQNINCNFGTFLFNITAYMCFMSIYIINIDFTSLPVNTVLLVQMMFQFLMTQRRRDVHFLVRKVLVLIRFTSPSSLRIRRYPAVKYILNGLFTHRNTSLL